MKNWLDELIDRHTESPPKPERGEQPPSEKPTEHLSREPPELKPLRWIPQSFDDGAHRRYMQRYKPDE